jgi:DDE family transposase
VIDESAIRQRFETLLPVLDERSRRRFAAAEALAAGRGGIAAVARATGIAPSTIGRALREVASGEPLEPGRVRRPGAGGKLKIATDASLLDDLRALMEPDTRGDPQSPLLWTSKSLSKLAEALCAMGHRIGRTLVGELLHQLGYSLQANRKTREGASHPDRDAQFRYINDQVNAALAAGEPAISVDTKKKELVGDFKNGGREWRPQGSPEEVRVHDFVIPELGRAVPYGVYDIADNTGWVSVGIDHDTAAFAANAIRSWWIKMGRERYPDATRLVITADGGGSNGLTGAAVETGTPEARRRTRHVHHRVPPAARHQQVEQDRASPVLLHHCQLAWQAPGQPQGHRRADCRNHNRRRFDGALPTRPQHLSARRQSPQCQPSRRQDQPP